jgi:hypothetical protein
MPIVGGLDIHGKQVTFRAGRVRDGDLVAFLWIGAGNGAMNGYAAMVL